MAERTAVLLLQMGGPDSLDAVQPFLYNLFSDRDIIRLGPAFLQPFIARFIALRRTPKVTGYYEQIGGKSPLRELTEGQAQALEARLGPDFACFVAMRYWHPSTIEALAAIRRAGIRRIIALPLYPHYCRATTGSSLNELRRVLAEAGNGFQLSVIEQFHAHPRYIDALAEKITAALEQFHPLADVELLFSAHSVPQALIDGGDPYLAQVEETVRLVMERFDLPYHLGFQSRAGPVQWLSPDTEELIGHLAGHGVKNLLVIPLSFVSDHIETLYEIDLQYAQVAFAAGYAKFRRSDSLNDSPAFIDCLAQLVESHLQGTT